KPDGKLSTAQSLRAGTEAEGYQVLGDGSFDVPLDQGARGWAECGELDPLGHKLEAGLARHIAEQIERIANRIIQLLDQGWETVRVVTDHGWLLVPGGMPKVDLPKPLTESRWARWAVISGESTPDVDRFPWYWNDSESFATAPGIACFNKSAAYAHGGLSVQECLTPDITVTRGASVGAQASITSIEWRGMRCLVDADSRGGVINADLRLHRASGESVVLTSKPLDEGTATLLLDGDEHEDADLVLVLVDEGGIILAHRPTRVGEST
ncbi:MAG: BREX-1 system phosphatase PglZ type B, partial [Gemmatimonadales bacterium]|nr:BREX-1 system phosphatase PglZ type B [Gemmatimonadales bacterium]